MWTLRWEEISTWTKVTGQVSGGAGTQIPKSGCRFDPKTHILDHQVLGFYRYYVLNLHSNRLSWALLYPLTDEETEAQKQQSAQEEEQS